MYSRTMAIIFALISANSFANTQETCLAQTIYHESRGTSDSEQRDIAKLVINRTRSNKFPKTICGVVSQKNQFKWTKHKLKISDQSSWLQAKKIAREVMNNPNISNLPENVVFFKTKKSKTRLAKNLVKVSIGKREHVFFAMRG